MSAIEIIATAIAGATVFIGAFIIVPLEVLAWRRRVRLIREVSEMLRRHRRWVSDFLRSDNP